MEKPEEMIALPISDLVDKTVVPLNWYVKLGEGHFVLVFKAGTVPSKNMMERWSQKGVTDLFVNADEYEQFASQNVTIASMLAGSRSLGASQKMTLIKDAAEAVSRELNSRGMAQAIFQHVRVSGETIVDYVSTNPDLNYVIAEMNHKNHSGVNHSLAVAIVSVMIAVEMRWNNPVILEKVAMAGFIHDIGESQLPREMLLKTIDDLTPIERAKYESHTQLGKDIIEGFKFIPEELLAVVHQHHENGLGTGYPQRLTDEQLHPISRIVSLANLFCSMVIRDVRHPQIKGVTEALNTIETELGQPYNADVFASLKRLNRVTGRAAA